MTQMTWNNLTFWKTKTWFDIKKSLSSQSGFQTVVPDPGLIFRPFALTPLDRVRVVFMMPEAYSTPGVANGLAFSWKKSDVSYDFKTAPIPFHALINELDRNMKVKPPTHGDLSKWARQGVLLWNSRPTTIRSIPNGHLGLGWKQLTEEIVDTVYLANPKTVFVFFGETKFFQTRLPPDANIMTLPVPMPFRDTTNIAGSCLFSQVNDTLKKQGDRKINWSV